MNRFGLNWTHLLDARRVWYSQRRCRDTPPQACAAGSPSWTGLWRRCSWLQIPRAQRGPRSGDRSAAPSPETQTHHLRLHSTRRRSANVTRITLRVFLAPSVLLKTMVSGPPMEQMFFRREPPHTGTVETAKSWKDKTVLWGLNAVWAWFI